MDIKVKLTLKGVVGSGKTGIMNRIKKMLQKEKYSYSKTKYSYGKESIKIWKKE